MIENSSVNRTKNSSIFCIAETHLTSLWSDSELRIDGYSCVRKDRTFSRGGVLVYIPHGFVYKIRSDIQVTDDHEIEYLWFEFQFPNSRPFLVNFVYQPDTTTRWREQFNLMLKMADSEGREIIILGDLNSNVLDKKVYKFLHRIVSQYQLKQ